MSERGLVRTMYPLTSQLTEWPPELAPPTKAPSVHFADSNDVLDEIPTNVTLHHKYKDLPMPLGERKGAAIASGGTVPPTPDASALFPLAPAPHQATASFASDVPNDHTGVLDGAGLHPWIPDRAPNKGIPRIGTIWRMKGLNGSTIPAPQIGTSHHPPASRRGAHHGIASPTHTTTHTIDSIRERMSILLEPTKKLAPEPSAAKSLKAIARVSWLNLLLVFIPVTVSLDNKRHCPRPRVVS